MRRSPNIWYVGDTVEVSLSGRPWQTVRLAKVEPWLGVSGLPNLDFTVPLLLKSGLDEIRDLTTNS